MKSLEVFMPFIMPVARGVALPAAFHAVRKASREFCRRTRLWRGGDSFQVTPEQCASIAVPYGAELFEIERVDFNGSMLEPVSLEWLDDHYPNWAKETAGSPSYVTQLAPSTIAVVPTAAGCVTMRLTLMPNNETMDVPDFLADKYAEIIATGALASILMLPGNPFTSPQLAQYYQLNFDRDLDRLTGINVSGEQRAPTRTRARFF